MAAFALWPDGPRTTHAGQETIAVGDFWFCDASFQSGVCETTVAAGTTVSWDFDPAAVAHTTTECGNDCGAFISTGGRLWHSGNLTSGTFEFTFTQAGTFNYQCNLHPMQMQGRIIVEGAPATATDVPLTPTPPDGDTPPPPTPGATATPTATSAGLTGDANADGSVNAIDASLVLQLVAGLLPSLPPSADADLSGETDAIDAALILQFVAGLIGQLPP